jgi:hypothetical protein
MPVYNAESYVAEAIESVLAQTFRDFEFLIFDDGSTDRSLSIINNYAGQDGRVKVFAKPHYGYVPLLNEGARMARGHFIARMDADDISLPERFDRQVQFLLREPECVALGCDFLMIDPDGEPICRVECSASHEAIETDLLQGGLNVICHPASLIRKSVLLAIGGYSENYETIEDFDLWLRLAERGRLANLPELLFYYRQHHHSVNVWQYERQKDLADTIISEARCRRGLKPLEHTIWKNVEPKPVWRHQHWARIAASSGYRKSALKHAIIAIGKRPLSLMSWFSLFCALSPSRIKSLAKFILTCTNLRKPVGRQIESNSH